ncbi:hypothetical protein SKAU_G00039190 [Synaphobranchus kaupii]|uniref:SEA domain-containing protein n=1 Tax=Synaphobranchus kaupii TaxID=118154 RepID=A0A9Q1JDY9_SYNKA|nr:hypothetical protein SKAU_G00039190 [Synaphobranchus kaupii]
MRKLAAPRTTTNAGPTRKVIEFTSSDTFLSDLLLSNSEAFQTRAQDTMQVIERVFRREFQSFFSFTVRSFSPGSIITTGELAFNSADVPSDAVLISTMQNNDITSALNIVPNSIILVPVVGLQATLQTVFVPALNDRNSPQFQSLAFTVITVCDVIYSRRFGLIFIRTIVIRFRGVARSRMEQDTEAQIELEFNENATAPIPTSDEVATTLVEAVTNPNNTFNISIDPQSISVTSVPNNIVELVFTSTDIFVNELSNTESAAFRLRAQITRQQIEPVFSANFSSFVGMTVRNFRAGSIITNSSLAFNGSQTQPSATEIGNSLRNAVQNGQVQLNIDPDSITVNGTAIASSADGVGTKTSLFTASCLVAAALLLTHSW